MTGPSADNGDSRWPNRFSCTPSGVIASSRRRFSTFLLVLALLMLTTTVAMLVAGRFVPAALAAGVGVGVGLAWRMSRELSPHALEISNGQLTVQTASVHFEVRLEGALARCLETEEIDHVRRLASAAGLVAGVGGFDSHLLGEFDLYAADLDNAVLVDSGEDRFVITPDNPTDFIAAAVEAGAKT